MMNQKSAFTPQEFIDKLQRNEITSFLSLTGMVKVAEHPSTELMFAPGIQCVDWISVPTDVIESVEFLDLQTCHDHTHPLVILTFKAPGSSEGEMFAALLRAAVKRGVVNPAVRPLRTTNSTPIRARLVTRRSGVSMGSSMLRWGGCAAACNEYEVDEAGNIYQLYSCHDYGGGIYACYYQ